MDKHPLGESMCAMATALRAHARRLDVPRRTARCAVTYAPFHDGEHWLDDSYQRDLDSEVASLRHMADALCRSVVADHSTQADLSSAHGATRRQLARYFPTGDAGPPITYEAAEQLAADLNNWARALGCGGPDG